MKKVIQSKPWWVWVKVVGGIGLVGLILSSGRVSPVVAGVVLHIACDFTFQSHETSTRKAERGPHLVIHSFIAGGIPGLVTGLMAGGPIGALTGFLVGIASHYAIDYSRKYGIQDWRLAIIADQLSHIAVLLVLASL